VEDGKICAILCQQVPCQTTSQASRLL